MDMRHCALFERLCAKTDVLCLDGAVRAQRRLGIFALWSNGIPDYQTNQVSPFGECVDCDDDVLIGGVYCIVVADEPRLYRVGSR